MTQPWFRLPRAGEHASKGPVFQHACENVLKGSLLDSEGAVSAFGSRVTRSGASGDAAVSEKAAHATAGESEEIIGLHVSHSSFDNSSNSLGCDAAVACALLPVVSGVFARVCAVSSSSAVSAVVAHARSTPMHVAHNSWSDTVRSQVPREGGVPKVGFPVRPKICVLSQRWRQG